MEKALKIAVILTAIDNMSNMVENAVNKSLSSINKFSAVTSKIAEGTALLGVGVAGLSLLQKGADAFGEMQEAQNNLKSAMLQPGGILDTGTYEKMFKLSEQLSRKYAGSTSAYLDMMRVLKTNRISESDIIGGVAKSTAQLADLFGQMPPMQIAEFAARMHNDLGIKANQMGEMMNMVAKLQNIGVGKTGPESVQMMTDYFSKVGLNIANLGIQGQQAGKQLGLLGAMFMTRGVTAESTGTNIRRILDSIKDPDKLSKVHAAAAQYGRSLDFFDKQGKFIGITNMIDQLGKLQGLSTQTVSQILKPIGGRMGLANDFVEFIANKGIPTFKAFSDQYERQAS